jgi:RNA polymerase sigma factor (sigma-70 family)
MSGQSSGLRLGQARGASANRPCHRHATEVWMAYCSECTAWHLGHQTAVPSPGLGQRPTDRRPSRSSPDGLVSSLDGTDPGVRRTAAAEDMRCSVVATPLQSTAHHRGHADPASRRPGSTALTVDPTSRPRPGRPASRPVPALGHRTIGGSGRARPDGVAHGRESTAPRTDGYEITAQLVRRAAGGDEVASDAIVDGYSRLLWSVVRGFRLTDAQAADAVQTTWVRLLENLDAIREPERLGGWLRTTARRVCLETVRRASRECPVDPQRHTALEQVAGRADDPEAHVLRQERAAMVREALGKLPQRHQRLLELLVASPPLSYEEISARLGMPVGSIGPTRARLLTRLRTALAPAVP